MTRTRPTTVLDESLAELRATRARTLGLAEGLTQSQLERAPARGGWSAGEVLDHVLLAEGTNRRQIDSLVGLARAGRRPELSLSFSDVNVSVPFLPRAALPLLEAPLTLMNAFVPQCLRTYLTRNRLVPFRNPDQAEPRRGRAGAQLLRDLRDSFQETEAIFRDNPDLDYGGMFLQHPLLGRYDVPGLLRFMSAHEQRHQSQLSAVISGA